MEYNRQTNKIFCYCERCGNKKIIYPGTRCSHCGPWGIMKSVEEFKKQFSVDEPPFLGASPDTFKQLLEFWKKHPPP